MEILDLGKISRDIENKNQEFNIIYDKEFRKSKVVVMPMTIVHSNGKTTYTTIVPTTWYYPERYAIFIKAYNSRNILIIHHKYEFIQQIKIRFWCFDCKYNHCLIYIS